MSDFKSGDIDTFEIEYRELEAAVLSPEQIIESKIGKRINILESVPNVNRRVIVYKFVVIGDLPKEIIK